MNLSEQLERSSDFRGFVRVRSMSGHDDVCRLLDGGVGDTCAATLWYDCGAMDEPFDFVLGAISGGESGLAAMDLQGQFGEQRYRVDFRGRTTGAEACDVVLVQGSPDGEEIVQALGGG